MLPKRSSVLSPFRAACGNRHADEARLVFQQLPYGSREASWLSGALPFTIIVKWRSCWWGEVFQHYEMRDFLIRGNDDVPTSEKISYIGIAVVMMCNSWSEE